MSDRLHEALLGLAEATRKAADAMEKHGASPMGINIVTGERFKIDNERTGVLDYAEGITVSIPEPHASILTATTDRDILETVQAQADELLHAIDLAGHSLNSAIALQTLDLVRGKVKDVLANLAGTIEKDL